MNIGLDEHRARQSMGGLSAHCKFLHTSHHYVNATGNRNWLSGHSVGGW